MQAANRSHRTDLAVETSSLTKAFGTTRAVDGVDLAIPRGAVYGFLGPNGAGKTTTIRILATLLPPDGGTALVLGHDFVDEADAVRGKVSLTAQFASLDQDLTGFENLTVLGRLLGHSWKSARARALDLLEAFELGDAGRRQVAALSGGMRRRLDIAASLIVTPELLFLDEPTTGLDPRSRRQVWDIVRAIVEQGTTVLLTTQDLAEADQLAERIAVIDHGKIIAEGRSGELKASVGGGSLRVRLLVPDHRPSAERILSRELGVSVRLDADPAALSAQVSGDEGAASERVARAVAELSRSAVTVTDFSFGQPSLDEAFLALTGRRAETVDTDKEAA